MPSATFLAILALGLSSAPLVDVDHLVRHVTDLEGLTRMPSPSYALSQSSSYDRASTGRDEPNWFANGDAGRFLRVEERDGRKEHVLADLKGPGAVVRFWSANPDGVVRFYFDGEAEARFAWPLPDFLNGKVDPMGDPWAYVASAGWNNYFPIPFAQSLKVTVDESGGGGVRNLYYQIGVRSYRKGTRVESLTQKALANVKPISDVFGLAMSDPETVVPKHRKDTVDKKASLAPGERKSLVELTGPAAIVRFAVRPSVRDGRMRLLRFQANFDGELAIDTPLGDFFGAGPGQSAFQGLPFEVRDDGWMVCRLWMPYRKNATLRIQNTSKELVQIELQAVVAPYAWTSSSMHLKAQWTIDRLFTRPMVDLNFLDTDGPGMWIGSHIHVSNPVQAWWGEGDEKIYVDNEPFPSTFGTGTEDYYGYAWCSPQPFSRPFHAQPRCDGPANFGNTLNSRWHIADPIPFEKHLRFDLELWHWAETTVSYARTAIWYGKPGTKGPQTRYTTRMLPPDLEEAPEAEGTLQGEDLKWTATGGNVDIQRGIGGTSKGAHLWWTQPAVGDTLKTTTSVPEKGRYRLDMRTIWAGDYGIHRLKVNGKAYPWPFDFYATGIGVATRPYGVWDLEGPVEIEWECVGANPKASPGNMLAIDTIRLVRVD